MALSLLLKEDKEEEILNGGNERYLVFPPDPKYQDLWELYEKHRQAFWVAEDIDYSADLTDWEKLSNEEKHFVEMILAFFAGSDGLVLENLVQNFFNEVKISEARSFYTFQGAMENIHAHTYALLIHTYIKDDERKNYILNAMDTIPVVTKKADWAKKWMDPNKHNFGIRLCAFAVVEGVFFSGAFCAIFWLKDRNLLTNGLGQSNEFIARDEALHVEFAVALFHHLKTKPKPNQVHEMVKEAVKLEEEFICHAVSCDLIGMDKNLMTQYIHYVSDRLLIQLGYDKLFNATNPFLFMDKIGLDTKSNFFERRVSEYKKVPLRNLDDNHFKINKDDNF